MKGELQKTEQVLQTERMGKVKEMELKNEQFRQAEAKRQKDLEAEKAEKEFLMQDLRKLQETLQRKEAVKPVRTSESVAQSKEMVQTLKAKRKKVASIPSGFDE